MHPSLSHHPPVRIIRRLSSSSCLANFSFLKDGKPYILSAAVGQSIDDPRNKGFNISVKTTFASMEDMKYYDNECEAHKALKAVAGPVKEDVLTTYYENIL